MNNESSTRFQDRVAFITGAGQGIGKAMATEIIRLGGRVAIADIDLPTARATATELGESALAIRCDVSDPESVDAAVDLAAETFGGIDILINNAALHLMSWNRRVTELTTAEWRHLMDVNVIGLVNCARAARPHMATRPGAAMLNISSIAGMASENAYGVSKLAVRGLTVSLAVELAGDGIRVNALAPGAVDSENAMDELSREILDDLIQKKQLIKRQGTRTDLVEAMKYLCSDAASFVTGETLIVGGGYPRRI